MIDEASFCTTFDFFLGQRSSLCVVCIRNHFQIFAQDAPHFRTLKYCTVSQDSSY